MYIDTLSSSSGRAKVGSVKALCASLLTAQTYIQPLAGSSTLYPTLSVIKQTCTFICYYKHTVTVEVTAG